MDQRLATNPTRREVHAFLPVISVLSRVKLVVMPKYVYQGLNTGVTFELEQRITEAALTNHPETDEPVKRLIGRPAISFKGSGFYANDSKGSSGSETKTAPTGDAKPSVSNTDSSSPTAPSDASATPAPTKEAAPVATPAPAAPVKSAD